MKTTITTETNILATSALKILRNHKTSLDFYKLWNALAEDLSLDVKDKTLMAEFYTSILLDKKFVMVGNNEWSLRENFKYSDIVLKIASVYDLSEDEEEESSHVKPKTTKKSKAFLLEDDSIKDENLPSDMEPTLQHSDDDVALDDELGPNPFKDINSTNNKK